MYIFQKRFHVGHKNMDILEQINCMLEDTRHFLENANIDPIVCPICCTIIIVMVSKIIDFNRQIQV